MPPTAFPVGLPATIGHLSIQLSAEIYVARTGATDEEAVRAYFAQFGHVSKVIVKKDPDTGKSRGAASVAFWAREASNAVLAFPVHVIGGKSVDVRPCVPNPRLAAVQVYVGGIGDADEENVYTYFNGIGRVAQVAVQYDMASGAPLGFAFVAFEHHDTTRLLNKVSKDAGKTCIDPRTLDIRPCVPELSLGGTEIFVGATGSADRGMVTRYFEQFGRVERVIIAKDDRGATKGYAFVEFDAPESAQAALARQTHIMAGKRIGCRPYDSIGGQQERSMREALEKDSNVPAAFARAPAQERSDSSDRETYVRPKAGGEEAKTQKDNGKRKEAPRPAKSKPPIVKALGAVTLSQPLPAKVNDLGPVTMATRRPPPVVAARAPQPGAAPRAPPADLMTSIAARMAALKKNGLVASVASGRSDTGGGERGGPARASDDGRQDAQGSRGRNQRPEGRSRGEPRSVGPSRSTLGARPVGERKDSIPTGRLPCRARSDSEPCSSRSCRGRRPQLSDEPPRCLRDDRTPSSARSEREQYARRPISHRGTGPVGERPRYALGDSELAERSRSGESRRRSGYDDQGARPKQPPGVRPRSLREPVGERPREPVGVRRRNGSEHLSRSRSRSRPQAQPPPLPQHSRVEGRRLSGEEHRGRSASLRASRGRPRSLSRRPADSREGSMQRCLPARELANRRPAGQEAPRGDEGLRKARQVLE